MVKSFILISATFIAFTSTNALLIILNAKRKEKNMMIIVSIVIKVESDTILQETDIK